MDEDYRIALRAWQSSPHDEGAVESLWNLALRTGVPLPPELDLRAAFVAHTERVQETYALLDGGGYVHCAAGRFIAARPPYLDLDGLRDSITSLSEGEAEEGQLPYPCLAVSRVDEVEAIPCGLNTGWGPDGCPQHIAQGFQAFEAASAALAASFPGLRVFEVCAEYPDDGQVYWDQTYLLWLPYHPGSFLCVAQHVW